MLKDIMIISITPNPSLDISGMVPELIPNEKAYVSHEFRLPGGNGVNAARIAHRLGASVLATGFLGGSAGSEFSSLLDKEKIPHHFISIKGVTRSNLTISLEKSHEQTRLSFAGPKISYAEKKNLIYFLERSLPEMIILGGSFPAGISTAYFNSLIKKFRHKDIPVFLDVPGHLLRDLLQSQPLFIKPNLTEFQLMSGSKASSISEVLHQARKFSPLISFQCISSVDGGALLVTPEHSWFGKIPKIKVLSTVGAGDSMVGAMAYAYNRAKDKFSEQSCERMLRWGLAAAAATLSNKGLTMGTRTSMKHFYPLIKIHQLD
jgi:1-phosphofructokinase family hexose kinase